jgi:S-adenosylmethionine/arginine decarboxylase-like enzyme
LALHTWPELGAITFDVYVCNFSMDNSGKAATLLESLIKLFQPTDIVRNQLTRGEVGAVVTTA